jgi:hypothetical protein
VNQRWNSETVAAKHGANQDSTCPSDSVAILASHAYLHTSLIFRLAPRGVVVEEAVSSTERHRQDSVRPVRLNATGILLVE